MRALCLLGAGLLGACTGGVVSRDYVCNLGATQSCFCSEGALGLQACREARDGWEDCECGAGDTGCAKGSTRLCLCEESRLGLQACPVGGSGWSDCTCDASGNEVCTAGEAQLCACEHGGLGVQSCADAGDSWDACTCVQTSQDCTPGATQVCVCTDGSLGAQTCEAGGTAWSNCACTGGAACVPGATQACICNSGEFGLQVCAPSGVAWEACTCADGDSLFPNSCGGTQPLAGVKGGACRECGTWQCVTAESIACVGDTSLTTCSHPDAEAAIYACTGAGEMVLHRLCPAGCVSGSCTPGPWQVVWEEIDSGQRLWAVWGTPGGEVWAVGTMGLVVHFDGSDWRTVDHGLGHEDLTDVWADGTQVWATGGDHALVFDGAQWRLRAPPGFGWYDLTSVWSADGERILFGTRANTLCEFSPTWLSPAPVGDTCATAPTITVSGSYSGDTRALGHVYSPTELCGDPAYGHDQVWAVDMSAGQVLRATIEAFESPSYEVLYLVEDCDAIESTCLAPGEKGIEYSASGAGRVYLIADSRTLGSGSRYQLDVWLDTPVEMGSSSGDNAAAAIAITQSGRYRGDTTALSDAQPDELPCGNHHTGGGHDQFWKVPLAAGDRLSAWLRPGATSQSVSIVTDASDPSGSCVASTYEYPGHWSSAIAHHACSAQTVYLIVDSGSGGGGPYDLEMLIEPGPGSTCGEATTIAEDGIYRGVLGCGSDTYSPTAPQCTGIPFAPGVENVWRFDLLAGTELRAEVETYAFDPVVYLVRDCGAIDDTCLDGDNEVHSSSLGTGVRFSACRDMSVFLLVDGATAGARGEYDLVVELERNGWLKYELADADSPFSFWGASRAQARVASSGGVLRWDEDTCGWPFELTNIAPAASGALVAGGAVLIEYGGTAHWFDGAAWQGFAAAPVGSYALWGSSTSNLYGLFWSGVWRFDGTAWAQEEHGLSDLQGSPAGDRLADIGGADGAKVYAVGRHRGGIPVIIER